MKKNLLLAALFISLISLPGLCADKLKIGSAVYKAKAPVILNAVGDSATVSFGGTSGRRVGTANFIFQKLSNQIVQDAEFDVVTGANGEDGKVLITFTDQKVSGRGKVSLLASDAESTATGKIKILSVDENGNFSFSSDIVVSNALKRITNPLSGNLNGTDSRFKGIVKISGTLNAVKP